MGCASALFFDTMMGMKKTGEAEYDLSMAMNGCLGGLVGITAGCAVVEPWAAVVIGLISGIIYALASKLLIKLKIDDAVDAIPVHLFNGMWGCIALGYLLSQAELQMPLLLEKVVCFMMMRIFLVQKYVVFSLFLLGLLEQGYLSS